MLRKARFCPFSAREYDFPKASMSAITINLFLLIVCLNLHSPHPKGENFLTKEIILQSDSEKLPARTSQNQKNQTKVAFSIAE